MRFFISDVYHFWFLITNTTMFGLSVSIIISDNSVLAGSITADIGCVPFQLLQ